MGLPDVIIPATQTPIKAVNNVYRQWFWMFHTCNNWEFIIESFMHLMSEHGSSLLSMASRDGTSTVNTTVKQRPQGGSVGSTR